MRGNLYLSEILKNGLQRRIADAFSRSEVALQGSQAHQERLHVRALVQLLQGGVSLILHLLRVHLVADAGNLVGQPVHAGPVHGQVVCEIDLVQLRLEFGDACHVLPVHRAVESGQAALHGADERGLSKVVQFAAAVARHQACLGHCLKRGARILHGPGVWNPVREPRADIRQLLQHDALGVQHRHNHLHCVRKLSVPRLARHPQLQVVDGTQVVHFTQGVRAQGALQPVVLG